ncbi:MAG: glycosyltransferase family 2 protein [Desulfuromonadales bacterium]|nr:glycosyltransferase family 2 protein [Desulfuromonadales bacterium]
MPRVTIGLPVFNGAKYLEEALDSLCRQTYGDFELIISDNASTDPTREICQDFAAGDPRIRYFRNEHNLGAAGNYNRVFTLARGELFKWAAHDDLCAPTLLERCLEALEANPEAVLAYPQTVIIDGSGHRVKRYEDNLDLTDSSPAERLRRYLFRAGEECNAVFGLMRASVLRKTRLIEPYNASDRVLLAHLVLLGKFCEVPQELFFRRDHPTTSLRANGDARAVAAWFDPKGSRRIVLPVSRLYFESACCVLQAELRPTTRLRCLYQVARRFWWHRQGLGKELRTIPRSLLGILPVSGPRKEGS